MSHRKNTRGGLSVVGYRFGPTLRRRGGGYIALVILIGLIGGLSLASIAGARRTQSSYPTFLAATNPSDLSLGTGLLNPSLGYDNGYDTQLVKRISSLAGVERAKSFAELALEPLGDNGQPIPAVSNPNVTYNVFGSVDGEYFTQDRVTVVQGKMANPALPDEVVATAGAAKELGLKLGKASPWGIYSDAQAASLSTGEPVTPLRRVDLTLVGIVVFNNGIVQDDTDAVNNQSVILTPALTRPLATCCSYFTFTELQLRRHGASVRPVESEIVRVMPAGLPLDFFDPTVLVGEVEHSIKPEAIALGVFGAIAALAALLIAGQMIARQLRSWTDEAEVLRSLGAPPTTTILDGVSGIAASVVAGAVVACLVAVALSPLFPIGPVRAVYPDRGLSVDWTVLGLGVLVIVGVLWCAAYFLARRLVQRRLGQGVRRDARVTRSRMAAAAANWGAPAPAVTGIRFAFEGGADTAPVRSAILGAVLALLVVVATIVFGASLDSLVSHPALYGWNWTYELSGGGGVGDIPQARAQALLTRDHQISAWSRYYFANIQIDGRTVPALGGMPGATVTPPVLSGHGLNHSGQVVLGEETLQLLHKSIGDTVVASYGATTPHRLRIVGAATMPAIGISGVTGHLTMGTGAWVDYNLIPASARNSFGNTPAGPNAIFVQLRSGVEVTAARKDLVSMANRLSLPSNYGVTVVSVQRPAEIVNYRTMGSTPAILGIALSASAVAALGLTLVASVRRRRREMAVLKAMGFTGRQLAESVAWQASVAVVSGVIVGVPLGIVLGRLLWILFAKQIYVVPEPAVPAMPIILISLGALALGIAVSFIPGRVAERTPTAVLLRAE